MAPLDGVGIHSPETKDEMLTTFLVYSPQRGLKGRAKDDADMERALRFHHPFAPDVVRSTIGQPLRINDKTIDRICCSLDNLFLYS